MKRTVTLSFLFLGLSWTGAAAVRKGDDFGAVVKTIEQFYHVKHQSIPFVAKAGMKVATTAARLKGGEIKRLAEAGSVRVAFFEGQDFDSKGRLTTFRTSLKTALAEDWMHFVQVLAPKEEEQTYIFLRDAGEKFNVLVVTIERRGATVVQVNLSPRTLAMLLQDPDEMGKAITDDATTNDQE